VGFSSGCGDESAYHITWSPPKISTAISPGGSWEGSISFISNIDLGGAELSVVPELKPFVSVYPQSFSTVVADTVNTFQISIAVPHDTTVDMAYEGTISLTAGDRACPETSEVKLYVAPSLQTMTGESYNATMELEIEACDLFHESEQNSGTQEARRITLEFLSEQAEVFDAGISEDGDIWIVYKDGVDSLISTSPPGMLGSGYHSADTEVLGGALASTMDYVTPGNKKAILLWTFCSDPTMQPEGTETTLSDLLDELSDSLAAIGYEVTSVRDADVTVDLLKSLYSYGVVDFVTHGAVWSNQVVLMTGEEATFNSFRAHLSDWTAHRLARRTVFSEILVESNWCIRPSFVTYYAAESYPNSLVVATACSSLANYSMANAFLNAGAYVYSGWTDTTYNLIDIDLFECLTEGMSVQQAFSKLDDEGATTCSKTGAQFRFYPSNRGDYKLLLASDVVTLAVSSTAGGSVTTPGEGTFTYNAGTVVNLVATPDASYYFVNWTGDVGNIANVNAATTTITMNGDYSITANFGGELQYTPMVSAGALHTVGLKSDGTVVAVGFNEDGQCNVGGWRNIIQVAAGGYHTVGLKSDGRVTSVGQNDDGQCDVGGWTNIIQVAAGFYHTVGLRSDGTVIVAGDNSLGQCNVGGWTDIIEVAAGAYHTVGLKADGTVVAVGRNNYGQCNVGGWTNIIQVAAGSRHTVALKSDATVVAVGYNSGGQCNVNGWTNIIEVAAGGGHTVGLKSDGTVIAAGNNSLGQCNVGGWGDIIEVAAGEQYTVALKFDGIAVGVGYNGYGQCSFGDWTNIIEVAAGEQHTVGLRSDGTAVAVGYNYYGQCNVGGWPDIIEVAAGMYHTVGLKSDHTVVAVGYNSYGQCVVSGWTNIVQVAAGTYHTVGLKPDGIVITVGDNSYGQRNVSGWTDITQVAAGGYHTVGLKADGTVVAVGKNDYGQCNVSGWTDIIEVAAGHYHTVGLKSDGTVVAAGYNYHGQCNVSGWTSIVQVAAGGYHTVGLESDGRVVAVGNNAYGQCSIGDWTDVIEIAAGRDHTVGAKSDGSVVAAGYNCHAQCNVSWTRLT